LTAPADTARPPSSPGIRDAFGPLLRIDRRDVAGLTWVKHRARFWLTALKRRRRYGVPRGAAYTPEESQLIEALTGLEREAGRLLDLIT
jgi:hypothetical protein